MLRRLLSITFWALLLPAFWQPLLGSSGPDSLRGIWNSHSVSDCDRFSAINSFYRNYTYSYPDSTLQLSQLHLKLAQEAGDQVQTGHALNEHALALCLLGQQDSALVIMETLVQMALEANDSLKLGIMYKNMGSIYGYQHRYQLAIRYYSMSLPIFEALDRPKDLAGLFNNMGLIYYTLNSYDLAREYLEKSHDIYSILGSDHDRGLVKVNLGEIYLKQGQVDVGLSAGREALALLDEEKFALRVADCYQLLGSCFEEMEQPDSASFYFLKSLNINRAIGNEELIARSLLSLAHLKFDSDVDTTLQLAEEVAGIVGNIPGWRLKADTYELLYKCYRQKGETDLSLEMLELSKGFEDSARVEEDGIAVVREAIRTEYELKMKENERENLAATAQLEDQQSNQILLLVGAGGLLLVVTLVLAGLRIRHHRRQAAVLLADIDRLKSEAENRAALPGGQFSLDRANIEAGIGKKLNETDWSVLNILLDDPVISNKGIADIACLSVDGIGSSLRRMYTTFEVKESRYKKISLLMEAIKMSRSQSVEKTTF